MYQFFQLIADFFANIFGLLNTAVFDIGGVSVSYSDLLLGFLALSILISVFWKGAKA